MRHGQAERYASDYVRQDITNLFAALNFKTGTVIGHFHRHHRAWSSQFLKKIDQPDPAPVRGYLIIDNYTTQKNPVIKRWMLRHLRFSPTGASWPNLVERWFVGLTEKQPLRGVDRSIH